MWFVVVFVYDHNENRKCNSVSTYNLLISGRYHYKLEFKLHAVCPMLKDNENSREKERVRERKRETKEGNETTKYAVLNPTFVAFVVPIQWRYLH